MKTLLSISIVALTFLAAPTYAKTCKELRTCADVVEHWCAGLNDDLDRDDDGIPCESKCSRARVNQTKAKIGCDR